MEAIFRTKILKFKNSQKFEVEDSLIREVKFDIFINEKFFTSLMATPNDEKALVLGFLFSEGFLESLDELKGLEISYLDEFSLRADAKLESRNLDEILENFYKNSATVSGCGVAKSANSTLKNLNAKPLLNPKIFSKSLVLSRMALFYTECELYEQTGCVHTAKLYLSDDEFFIGEDIAQHNTIDKAIGKAILAGANLKESFLMVSGRLSSEMVAKAVVNDISLLVSRTAPTYLGVAVAREFNLTLCGFARAQNINLYSGNLD